MVTLITGRGAGSVLFMCQHENNVVTLSEKVNNLLVNEEINVSSVFPHQWRTITPCRAELMNVNLAINHYFNIYYNKREREFKSLI